MTEQKQSESEELKKARAAADVAMEQMNLEEVIRQYGKVLKLDPEDMTATLNMGVAHAMSGKFKKAQSYLETVTQKKPEDAEAWFNLGLTYLEMDRQEDCLACLDKCLSLNPKNPLSALVQRGNVLMELDRHAEAIEPLLDAMGRIPKEIPIYEMLASCYMRTMQLDKAIEILTNALAEDPENINLRQMYGRALALNNDPNAAMDQFQQVVQENPDHPQAWMDIMLTHVERDDCGGALESANKALESDPDNHYLWLMKALLHTQDDDWSEAMMAYSKSTDLHPSENQEAWLGLANAHSLSFTNMMVAGDKQMWPMWHKILECKKNMESERWFEFLESFIGGIALDGYRDIAHRLILESGLGRRRFSAAAAIVESYNTDDPEAFLGSLSPEDRSYLASFMMRHAPIPYDEEDAGDYGEPVEAD